MKIVRPMLAMLPILFTLGVSFALGQQPAQQAPPPPPMSFFVTSVAKGDGGNYGGLAGADAHCQMLAQTAGRGNVKWVAYLSTQGPGAVNARDRIGQGPWANAQGRVIAANLAELHGDNLEVARMGNRLNKNTALTEKGGIVEGSRRSAERARHPDRIDTGRPRLHRRHGPHVQQLHQQRGRQGQRAGRPPRPDRQHQRLVELSAREPRMQSEEPANQRRQRLPVLLCPRQLNQRSPFSSRSHRRRNMRLATGAMSASLTFPSSSDAKAGCRRACLRASSASATHRS